LLLASRRLPAACSQLKNWRSRAIDQFLRCSSGQLNKRTFNMSQEDDYAQDILPGATKKPIINPKLIVVLVVLVASIPIALSFA
jgi:hypothetical protein